MGFKVSEAVEELTYDLEPYGPKGTISEPTSKQVERFRSVVFGSVRTLAADLGIDLGSDEQKMNLDMLDPLMEKSAEVETLVVDAVADLTGIANQTLHALPYRVKAAFCGWITEQFLNPEA